MDLSHLLKSAQLVGRNRQQVIDGQPQSSQRRALALHTGIVDGDGATMDTMDGRGRHSIQRTAMEEGEAYATHQRTCTQPHPHSHTHATPGSTATAQPSLHVCSCRQRALACASRCLQGSAWRTCNHTNALACAPVARPTAACDSTDTPSAAAGAGARGRGSATAASPRSAAGRMLSPPPATPRSAPPRPATPGCRRLGPGAQSPSPSASSSEELSWLVKPGMSSASEQHHHQQGQFMQPPLATGRWRALQPCGLMCLHPCPLCTPVHARAAGKCRRCRRGEGNRAASSHGHCAHHGQHARKTHQQQRHG